jgi:hypothetical protein
MIIAESKCGWTLGLRCAQWTITGGPTTHEADGDEAAPERRLGFDDPQGRGGVDGQRLLAQHGLARVQAGERERLVCDRRRGDHDGVDGVGRDQLEPVLVDRRHTDLAGDAHGALADGVGDRHDLGAGDRGVQDAGVGRPHQARADDPDADAHEAVGKCMWVCVGSCAWSGQRVVTTFARV